MATINKTIQHEDSRRINRYMKWTKFFLFIVVFFFVWTMFVVISIYFLEMGYRWSLLSINEWIYLGWGVIGFCLCLELIFYGHYRSVVPKEVLFDTPEHKFFQRKHKYEFTQPKGAKGGIFTRTVVKIDDHTEVNIRIQMISPKDLWKNK